MKKLSKQRRTKAKLRSHPPMQTPLQTPRTQTKSLRGVFILGGIGLFLAFISPLIPESILESTYSYTFPNGHSTHSQVGLAARQTALNWSDTFLLAALVLWCALSCVPPLLASVRRAWQQRPQWTLPAN